MKTIEINRYIVDNQSDLIAILRLNTPNYFAYEEEADFIKYMEEEREDYYVINQHHSIIGCGGINYSSDKNIAILSWDILHPDHQRKGLGKLLFDFRMAHITSQNISNIVVRTSQLAYPFYQKQGFAVTETIKDYWAKGLDLVKMEMVVR
jgi:N-acetylglutamate synthase-like GNAT family acetyltransferase